ncbi:helix-turn-helix transcriptional regulator [Chryseobacterium sp. c4a]|uniref:helix-turn-helix transcriptional regulator n=1 Tax=Chryseobacterium sp. c4a TaxID=1573582 RepID=UPI0013583CC5|nr:helix-turn-helix transcriptional regulator [Chryseobacterium sp. c4a]
MNKPDIELFYNQYVNSEKIVETNYTGHFDLLYWKDLKRDLSACERLQRKPFFKIALLKGEGMYQCNDLYIPISGYSIVFTDPLTRSSFQTNDKNFEGTYCICTDNFLRGTSKINLRNWPVFHDRKVFAHSLTESEYHHLFTLFNDIEKENTSDYAFKELVIRGRIFDIIHYVQKSIPASIISSNRNEDTLDERFFKQLETEFFIINPDQPLRGKTPLYFASKLNCSTGNLNQYLKRNTGKTTQQLIHDRIIEEADVLLRHSNYSIKEIAWCLHFQETPHFINFYKKNTGKTPMEYRTN